MGKQKVNKAVILAGGFGTRLSEETHLIPKPMVQIGERPILWHIMKIFSQHGINEFVICLGYKAYVIKEYFSNYLLHNSDVTFDLHENSIEVHHRKVEPWKISLIDTGQETMTAGRLAKVRPYLNDESFCFTYGDGVADVNIKDLIAFHQDHGKLSTVTVVKPPGRFGVINVALSKITAFEEKPSGDGDWINGGFFVLDQGVFDYINDDMMPWEQEPMKKLVNDGEMRAYKHRGFWRPMDTLRDKEYLNTLWSQGEAPWKTWSD